ncbi:hypothetical protein [Actinomadura sp. 9N215]|uniref:hypothetical protein n=1 Tax=Actinomadura sp. 9N215 TaxID=3375150 RepID=UPI0037B3CDBD
MVKKFLFEGPLDEDDSQMAWEWVAPVVTGLTGAIGVGFTWLAGAQSRVHAERMVEQSHLAEERARLFEDRRDAYFALLRWIDLVNKRADHEARGEQDKVQQFDEQWPWAKRIDWTIDVLIGVQAFGSERVSQLCEDWNIAFGTGLHDTAAELREQLRAVVRDELQGIESQRESGRNRR